jgi:hypothetical protein
VQAGALRALVSLGQKLSQVPAWVPEDVARLRALTQTLTRVQGWCARARAVVPGDLTKAQEVLAEADPHVRAEAVHVFENLSALVRTAEDLEARVSRALVAGAEPGDVVLSHEEARALALETQRSALQVPSAPVLLRHVGSVSAWLKSLSDALGGHPQVRLSVLARGQCPPICACRTPNYGDEPLTQCSLCRTVYHSACLLIGSAPAPAGQVTLCPNCAPGSALVLASPLRSPPSLALLDALHTEGRGFRFPPRKEMDSLSLVVINGLKWAASAAAIIGEPGALHRDLASALRLGEALGLATPQLSQLRVRLQTMAK